MKAIKATLETYLNEMDLRFTVEENIIYLSIHANNGNWNIQIGCDEERRLIQITSEFPVLLKRSRFSQICELLNRINHNTLLGKFSLDYESGHVILTTVGVYKETEISEVNLDILIRTNIETFDQQLPAIFAVNFNQTEPVMAFLETSNIALN